MAALEDAAARPAIFRGDERREFDWNEVLDVVKNLTTSLSLICLHQIFGDTFRCRFYLFHEQGCAQCVPYLICGCILVVSRSRLHQAYCLVIFRAQLHLVW